MRIELTPEQQQEVALSWIKQQQEIPGGYKKVLNTLLMGAHFAAWSWVDALRYAVMECAKAYHVNQDLILRDLMRAFE